MAETNFNVNTEEMEKAGLQFGHKTSKIHPKMMPFLSGVRNTVHIIDLEKSAEKLKEALKFIQKIISEDKNLLIVGTKIQGKNLIKNMADEVGLPYVSERWLGGTFTNFDIIKKRLEHFKDLETKKASGELEKYTKKERLLIDRKIKDLATKFGGIKNLDKLPEAIFMIDIKKDVLAVKEARAKGIKIIAISDTNTDPSLVDYPIPANDDAASSIKYILDKVKEAIEQAKSKTSKIKEVKD